MKNKNIWVVLLCLALLIGISSGAEAFWPQKGKPPTAERRIERMAKDLGLTAQQKEKYLAGEKLIEKEACQAREKNRAIFDKVENEVLKDYPNQRLLADYMRQISQNDSQIRLKRLEQVIQLRRQLTVEQKQTFDKIIKGRKGRKPPKPEEAGPR